MVASRSSSESASLEHDHTPSAIRERLSAGPQPSYLRDLVYGAIDGAITTLAVVSGVAGAGLSPGVIVVLGVANLIGDGFSMAAGNYLGTRADQQLREKTARMEERHIHQEPEGEREEIRQIFAKKGFSGQQLEQVVDVITSDRQQWIETMLKEEHDLPLVGPSPVRAALATFVAFVVAGAVPLAPFILNLMTPAKIASPFAWTAVSTGLAFFGVGAAKSRFVGHKWYWSGAETLLVGGIAATLAYLCGVLLAQVA